MIEKQINHEVNYLGGLCKRGHEYLNTGMSLRYKNDHRCCQCIRERGQKYYKKNRSMIFIKKKKYRDTHKIEQKAYRKKHMKQELIRQSENRRKLSDAYIKKLLCSKKDIKRKDVTPQMIESKRRLMLFNRLKRLLVERIWKLLPSNKCGETQQLNTKRHYLGGLCKRGHEYLNTGMSLRYKRNNECVECVKLYHKLYQRKESHNRNLARYYQKHKKELLEIRKLYKKKISKNLTDVYIKNMLYEYGLKREHITPQMIELKRELILFNRLKKEVLDGINSRGNQRTEANGQAG